MISHLLLKIDFKRVTTMTKIEKKIHIYNFLFQVFLKFEKINLMTYHFDDEKKRSVFLSYSLPTSFKTVKQILCEKFP